MKKLISVQNLTKSFKQYKKTSGIKGSIKSFFRREYFEVQAVDKISFDIDQGEIVGFIGPNGAGKTTTLKMLSGILYPTAGKIDVLGYKPFERKPEFQKQFAIVMGQKSQLWWDLPAMEGFILNKEIYEVPDSIFNDSINELAELLEVKDVLEIPVRKLSLGQRMKCELIASLLHRPRLLFLDEPTIGLDIIVQKKIRNFLKEYNQKYKTTVLLTSHYMDDVQELCNRIIVINKGKLIFDGSLSKLMQDYANNKYLKLNFNQKITKADLSKYGKIMEFNSDGYSATISVTREVHTKVAAEILSNFQVDDLDISEVSLEEVIGKIFSR